MNLSPLVILIFIFSILEMIFWKIKDKRWKKIIGTAFIILFLFTILLIEIYLNTIYKDHFISHPVYIICQAIIIFSMIIRIVIAIKKLK